MNKKSNEIYILQTITINKSCNYLVKYTQKLTKITLTKIN